MTVTLTKPSDTQPQVAKAGWRVPLPFWWQSLEPGSYEDMTNRLLDNDLTALDMFCEYTADAIINGQACIDCDATGHHECGQDSVCIDIAETLLAM